VAFNRERGGVKEVKGRLCCYKLYVQLRLEEKGGDNDQLCAQHHNLFINHLSFMLLICISCCTSSGILMAATLPVTPIKTLFSAIAASSFFVDSAVYTMFKLYHKFTKVKVQVCKTGGILKMAIPVPVNGEPSVPPNQAQPSVQEVLLIN
jgi:hypothetical protein